MMVKATPLPVSADLENGFGARPDTVAETIRQAAATGLAGCTIEDTTGKPDDADFRLHPCGGAYYRCRARAQ